MKKLLDLYRHKSPILNDAFDQVVVNIHLQKQKNGYKTFLLCGIEPMVGTTSVAINLAVSLSVSGWKTVLVDADLRKKKEFKRLNECTEKTLLDYLNNEADREEIIYHTNWELLDYIPSASNGDSPVRLLYSNRIEQLIDQLRNSYDFIILDVPSLNSSVDSQILSVKADAICLIASLGDSTKDSLKQAKMTLDSAGANTIGVIVNKVGKEEYKHSMKNFDYFKERTYEKNFVIKSKDV